MKVILVTETELKALGDSLNKDFLEMCIAHKADPDTMDQPGRFPNPLEGLYKKIHFTFHRWKSEVGSDVRIPLADTDAMKYRMREQQREEIGKEIERWLEIESTEADTKMAKDIVRNLLIRHMEKKLARS